MITALTTSFRYPRVQVGLLPTFEMPPPATIYGHLAGAVGEWFRPSDLEFSYVFEHEGKATDLETIHPIERGSGKATLKKRGWSHPVNVECSANIQRREFLLRPRLTLYLRSGDSGLLERLGESLLSPYFSYILGRSQDLATCTNAAPVELDASEDAYFANTLVPYEWRWCFSTGSTVVLPSHIDYARRRQAVHERYVHITRPALRVCEPSGDIVERDRMPARFVVDRADARRFDSGPLPRGLHFFPVRGPSDGE